MAEITTVVHKKPAVESVNIKLTRTEVWDLLYFIEEGRKASGYTNDPMKYPVYQNLKDAVEGKLDPTVKAFEKLFFGAVPTATKSPF